MRLGDEGTGTITIAAAADVGEAQTEVEAAIEGDSVQISFNARYLQALQSLDQDQLALELGSAIPGRPQADNVRRGLRPRHHAGPHALLIRGSNFMLGPLAETEPGGAQTRTTLVTRLGLVTFRSYASWTSSSRTALRWLSDPMPPARPTSSRAWSSLNRPLPSRLAGRRADRLGGRFRAARGERFDIRSRRDLATRLTRRARDRAHSAGGGRKKAINGVARRPAALGWSCRSSSLRRRTCC